MAVHERFAPLPESAASRPAELEEALVASWRAERVFESLQASRRDAPRFVFWEGPPTANGKPGIHHVFARAIKDAVCRHRTMLGRLVVRKAGWDTHGLPVELGVEKELGISGKPQIEAYGVARFNARCKDSVWRYKQDWERLSERIGYWLDYADPYVTYDDSYVESVWNILARLHRAGFAYRGKKVLPYCGRCGTGLSSHELGQPGAYKEVLDPSVHVRFKVVGSARGESLLAWTTTPWTLPSNIGLAVHPREQYVLAKVDLPVGKGAEKGSAGAELVWIAKARAQAVLGAHEVVEERQGRELEGMEYQPLFDAAVPFVEPGAWKPDPAGMHKVWTADYVTTTDGTGIVHQAAAYGVDDWDVARRNRLPVKQAVGAEGRLVVDVAGVPAGTFFKDADEGLAEDLKRRGLLFRKAKDPHSYPHCWRCDTPLFYYAAPAWYLRTSAIKERMIELNRQVRWIPPEIGSGRFGEWLENNIDWNISRDRYWGTPLPYWTCDGCDAEESIGSKDELAAKCDRLPEAFDFHKPSIDESTWPCAKCGGTMRRTKSVLDCWFDSGAMPYAQWHWPFGEGRAKAEAQYPADFIAEGLDQTRGWFYTLHAIGAFLQSLPDSGLPPGPPYKACLVNGLVLDKDGVKMSKRLGNIVDPWQAVSEHGADAVRWYLLSSGATHLPKRFDPAGILEVRRKHFGTLVNSWKFFSDYARLGKGFDPARPAPHEARPEIDRWLASRTQSTIAEVRARLDDYDLAGACRSLEEFVGDDLSNWYIRRNRARFWKGEWTADRDACFHTLHDALRAASLLMAPLAPFLSDAIWSRLSPGSGSVHAQLLPEPRAELVDEELEGAMRLVVRLVEMGRALRERAKLGIRQPLRAIHVRASDARALELLRTGFAAEQVLGELNIKSFGSLAADDGAVCSLKAKANFRVLGKKVGGLMKAVAAAIDALPAAAAARLRAGASVAVEVDGRVVELAPEDVEIRVETNGAFDVETDGRLVAWLDAELDEELVAEGLAREFNSRVNALRKDSGLGVEDRIALHLEAGGTRLAAALQRHAALIQAETMASTLGALGSAPAGATRSSFEFGTEGRVEVAFAKLG
jgi:isoleucyl-tRNA synthetase